MIVSDYAAVSNGSWVLVGLVPTVRTVGYKYAVRFADLDIMHCAF